MTTANGINNNGDGPTVTSTTTINGNSQETVKAEVDSTEVKTTAPAPPTAEDSHLNNHNSQINISKDNTNQNTNPTRNSLANNNDNNNTEQLYDIPVGE